MNALIPQPPSPYTAPPRPHAVETHTLSVLVDAAVRVAIAFARASKRFPAAFCCAFTFGSSALSGMSAACAAPHASSPAPQAARLAQAIRRSMPAIGCATRGATNTWNASAPNALSSPASVTPRASVSKATAAP